MLLCSVLVQLLLAGAAYTAHRQPHQFVYSDLVYILHFDVVTWDEADAICKYNSASLAVLDTQEKTDFMAQAILETAPRCDDMWVGGRRSARDWQWTLSGKPILEQSRQDTNMFAPWLDDTSPQRRERDCLAVARDKSMKLLFVGLQCQTPRPFLCERTREVDGGPPVQAAVLEAYGMQYTLYTAEVTWQAAVAFCRIHGNLLASVKNETLVHRLASTMLKTRPELEDMWIGAHYSDGHWVWIEDSQHVHMKLDVTGRRNKNCVVLDRHVHGDPKLMSVPCDCSRGFVCMSTGKSSVQSLRYKDKTYTIHSGWFTWDEARAACETVSGGQLLELRDQDVLKFIVQFMAESNTDIRHVWLAGRFAEDEWRWLYSDTAIPSHDLPWYEEERMEDVMCLNLDRASHEMALMYGLECSVQQGMMCVQPAQNKSVYIATNDVSLQVVYTDSNMTWQQTSDMCRDDTGGLLTAVDASQLAQITSQLHEGHYYIGAKLLPDGQAVWDGKSATFSLTDVPAYQPNSSCVAIVVVNVSDEMESSLEAVPCHQPMSYNFICKEACEDILTRHEGNWNCDWLEGAAVNERTLGKRCYHTCRHHEAAIGSHLVTCTESGWRGIHSSVEIPSCSAVDTALTHVGKLTDGSPGAVFIIDGSEGVSREDFKAFSYFILAQVSNLNMSESRSFAAIVMSNNSVGRFVVENTKLCDIMALLNSSLRSDFRLSGQRNFAAAFHDAKMWLGKRKNITTYLIAAGKNQGPSYKENLRKLKRQVKEVIAVGVNEASSDELADIASVSRGRVNVVMFTNTTYLGKAADAIYVTGLCESELQTGVPHVEVETDSEEVTSPSPEE